MKISLIVAADEHNGIGKNNRLLCHLSGDLKYFRKVTTGHHILMGRKTFESVGRPLPNRVNVVLTRDQHFEAEGCLIVNTLKEAFELAKAHGETEFMITGGDQIFKQCISMADRIYLTRIHHVFDADTFFPEMDAQWKLIREEKHTRDDKNDYDYTFQVYERPGI